jgi:hypothetical protein
MTFTEPSSIPAVDRGAAARWLPALLILFIGSGCAALIYEVVWFQLLQLSIGSSAVSLGVLLGIYMGGMCLGSLLLPRLVRPDQHPLRVYAFLELGIGLFGILVLYGVPIIGGLYTEWAGSGTTSLILRALVASICLLPPTLLMGGTLPVVARGVEATPNGVSWLGYFYGGNLVGAVSGSLLAGFYLLRVYDMPTATFAAVAINVIVAAIALIVAGQIPHEPVLKEHPTPILRGNQLVYVAIALSGMTALGAEVVWTRQLSACSSPASASAVRSAPRSRGGIPHRARRWQFVSCCCVRRSPGPRTRRTRRCRTGRSTRRSAGVPSTSSTSICCARSGWCCRRRSCGVAAFRSRLALPRGKVRTPAASSAASMRRTRSARSSARW